MQTVTLPSDMTASCPSLFTLNCSLVSHSILRGMERHSPLTLPPQDTRKPITIVHTCMSKRAHTHTCVYGMCSVRGSLCICRTCEAGYYGDRCGGVGPCFFSDVGKRVINNEKETTLKCKGWGVDMWVVSTFVNSGIHTVRSFYLRPVEPERDWNVAVFLLISISCHLIFMSWIIKVFI